MRALNTQISTNLSIDQIIANHISVQLCASTRPVLVEAQVDCKENVIVVAPKILQQVWVSGLPVIGAMQQCGLDVAELKNAQRV